jgi:hypothetical protein
MAEFFAGVSQLIDTLLDRVGIHGAPGLDAVYCVLGLVVFLVFCISAQSAIRMAFSRCSSRR